MIPRILNHIKAGWFLGMNKIRLQTKEHALGYGWAILTPVIYAVFFIIVKQSIVEQAFDEITKSWDILRAFLGVSLFQAWVQLVQEMSELVRSKRSLLQGMFLSEKPLVFAVVFEACFGLAIRVATIIGAVFFLGLAFPENFSAWGWLLISLIVLLVSATAIGLALAPWAALYPDVGKSIRSMNMPLLLLSPIFYSATTQVGSVLFVINCVNPLAPILATILDALEGNVPFYRYILCLWLVLGGGIGFFAVRQLQKQIPILLERMGT